MKKCSVEKAVGVNNNIDYIDCWPLIQKMNAGAYLVIGSDYHHIVFVSII